MSGFVNAYEDARRAEAYAKSEFAGTYYLAYRDLPAIIGKHARGKTALDFGCGTGRSTRFLQKLGLEAIGVDISNAMIRKAREAHPEGPYRLIRDGDFSQIQDQSFDLILSAFTFDNIPTMKKKVGLFKKLGGLLSRHGKLINLVSSLDIYINEWASFSTRDFPENRFAKSGDIVRIITTDLDDRRPVEDILWSDESYREVYKKAGLKLIKSYKPLATGIESYRWVSEIQVAPWVIYVLKKRGTIGRIRGEKCQIREID